MRKCLSLGAALALVAGPTLAQDSTEAASGLYGRISGGVNFGSNLEQDLTHSPFIFLPGLTPATRVSSEFETGYVAGVAIGFQYPDATRTELEYRFESSEIGIANPIVPDGSASFLAPPTERFQAHFLMANAYLDFPNQTPITPFIGVGGGGALISNGRGEQDADYAYQGRVGATVNVAGTRVGVEYVYLRTGRLEFGPKEFVLGSARSYRLDDGVYQSSSVLVSLQRQF